MIDADDVFVPEWPLPNGVRVLITTRRGGVSRGAYASLNLGLHVGDDPLAVAENRRRVAAMLPGEPTWLNQVHGTAVFANDGDTHETIAPAADAATTRRAGRPCAVLAADCLPILFSDERGSCVAAAHAGWRGLAAGVIERTIEAMQVAPQRVIACLGPAIGATAFEVGQEVVDAFAVAGPGSRAGFRVSADRPGKYLADIYALARQRLSAAGVEQVHGAGWCTLSAPERFFSYRRDGQTGRMAAIIWRE